MKSCESRIKAKTWNLQYMLSIVEVVATSADGRNPLQALEACKDKLSPEFLKRLAKRPETVVLLQCSCKLGCDGNCNCSLAPQGGMVDDIWNKFDRKNHTPIWRQTEEPQSTSGKKCSCDGYPRLTRDLLVRYHGLIPPELQQGEAPMSTLLSLLEYVDWLRSVWDMGYLKGISRIMTGGLTNSKPWTNVLDEFHALVNTHYEEDGRESESFYLKLANYLILNLATQRSLGYLNAYLPDSPEKIEAYLESNNPMKNLLARLVTLRDEIPKDVDGKHIAAFCIDLANITNLYVLPQVVHRGTIQSLGQAMLFATLFGGTLPAGEGQSGRGEPDGERGGKVHCKLTKGFEVKGHHLLEFLEYCHLPVIDERKIEAGDDYEIRGGRIYSKASGEEIEFKKSDLFESYRAWMHAQGIWGVDGVPPSSQNPVIDSLERMEDVYTYNKPSSRGWRELLRQHPILNERLSNPARIEQFEADGDWERDRRLMLTYFNRLSEDDDMIGQRESISSQLLPMRHQPHMRDGNSIEICRRDVLGDDNRHPLITKIVRDLIESRIYAVNERVRDNRQPDDFDELISKANLNRHSKAVYDEELEYETLQDLQKIENRLNSLIDRYSSGGQEGKDDHLIDEEDAIKDFRNLLDDLDFVEMKFIKGLHTSNSQPLDLYSADSAKHYRLSKKGVEILFPLGEEVREAPVRRDYVEPRNPGVIGILRTLFC